MHDEAIANYDNALEIAKKLIDMEPTDVTGNLDLSETEAAMGDALKAQGKLQLALKAYQAEAVAAKSAIKIDANDKYAPRDLVQAGSNIGAVAYDFILAREFAKALDAADIANSFAPGEVWIHARRAHALMFLAYRRGAEYLHYISRPKE
jgi:tetratricopeptide (TPR) repeat protein